MPSPGLKQLQKAEQLFDVGNLEEALKIFNDESQLDGLGLQQKAYFQFLKGLILIYQYKSDEIVNLGEQMFREGQKHNEDVQSFDGLFFIIEGLIQVYKFDEALKKIDKAENILRLISDKPKNVLIRRRIRLDLLKAVINLETGNIEVAEMCLEKPFDSQKELGNTIELVWANMLMAEILLIGKSRFDLAIEYTKKMLSIAKEIRFNHYWIVVSHGYFGLIFSSIGELDNSLKHYKKALKILKRFKSDFLTTKVLNNIGNIYAELGDYETALNYLEESLILWERDPVQIENCIDSIIDVALKKGDIGLAQKYFQRVKNIYNQAPDSNVEFFYHYNKALMLKSSSRIRDKAKAEKLFKRVIETKTIHTDVKINAYIHLCDLLLAEYRINNNREVLNEINQNITHLLAIAERSHSYIIFCETFILQAKLALLSFDVKAARHFLTQAQKIAELYGIKRLAMKISHEHDNLLKDLSQWDALNESKASLKERIKLARLDEQMGYLIKKRIREAPKLIDEESVLFLIVSEGGVPFFTQSFIEDKYFEDHLFGGFFTAINSFINEMFSEGLDRASFGKYTLLMNSVPPFLIFYVYKGQSYSAQMQIKSFIDELKSNKEMWDRFKKYHEMNRKIQIKDIPSLEPLIREIFIEKKLH